jgi:SNF2 family DNA or RNA helicase
LKELLGECLTSHIYQLQSIGPMQTPSVISIPKMHQLYAASRLNFLQRSRFRGGILADAVGMGKTLAAILLIVHTPQGAGDGPWIVVTKKPLISNWARELRENVRSEYELKVIVPDFNVRNATKDEIVALLTLLKTLATDLYNYDFVLTNYEYIRRQYSTRRAFINSFTEDGQSTMKWLPPRPRVCILSELHKDNNRPFRLILDEAHSLKR